MKSMLCCGNQSTGMIEVPRNPWWDTSSRQALERRQSALLRRFLRSKVAPFSAYYGKLFAEQGIDPKSIRNTGDLTRLPFTSKADLAEPRDFLLAPEEEALMRQPSTWRSVLKRGALRTRERLSEEFRPVMLTSTTGRSSAPVPFLYTSHDVANLQACGRRLMEICRTTAEFRIVNAFPFAPHLAFWQAHYAGLGGGRFVLSTGGGKVMGTDGNIRLIDRLQADALIAMPTFLYHLLQHAASSGMRWPKLRVLVLGGEKVPQGMRRKLRALCAELGAGAVEIVSTYGFTEGKMAWSECPVGEGETTGYHLYPDFAYVEIVDPKTGEPVPEGRPGEIVCTPLDARGTVVLRYRTGDLIDGGLVYDPCPACGRRCPRLIGNISRISDVRRLNLSKIKGVLVDFNALERVLDDTEGLGAWQIEVRKLNDDPLEIDRIVVHAVAMDGAESSLAERIRERLSEAAELTPNEILFHDWDAMRELQGVGRELKEKKVVDHRPKAPGGSGKES
ncbi:MAG TPA: AMP-binding protein [Verrucomicrobiales bacterium]|nr:AMP-binding protein [Verrucomicrobiales bacterium]